MARRRGFFLFDLTLAIVLIVVVASMFAHLVWLYNRDCVHLAAVRNAARNQQTMLYHAIARPQDAISKLWIITPVKISSQGAGTLPAGSHWMAIRSAGHTDVPTFYALTLPSRPSDKGGTK